MDNTSDNKLLILGFDGASPDLLSKWVEEGHLPTLANLMKTGAYGPLRSVPNMMSPAAWASFATGKNPGKHGIFSFTERNFNSYNYRYVNGSHRHAESFWGMLCGDRTGCVVNVPMTYPAHPLNGCLIAGLDAPGVDSEGICYPEGLVQEMSAKNGPYRVTRDFANLLRKEQNWSGVAEHMLENMDMRYCHASYLMDKYDWDLFVLVFGETDHAHHFYWKFLDPSHPGYSAEEAEKYGDTILRVYQRMDEVTRQLLENNPDVTLMIMSDHGGAIHPRGGQLVPRWLESMGLLVRENSSYLRDPRRIVTQSLKALLRNSYDIANRHLSTETKLKLIRRFPGLRSSAESAVRLGNVDWGRTRAYSDGFQEDIWINLAGRDPQGVVTQSEYDELCDFICSEIRDAVDVATGRSIVDYVFRRNEAYNGPYVDRAPDISIRWKKGLVVTGIKTRHSSSNIAPVEWNWPPDMFNGGHSLDGIFVAHGPHIAGGVNLEGAHIEDIAPTVLYHFGEEIPNDLDGKVLEAIFEPSHYIANPPRFGSTAPELDSQNEDIYSEEDSAVIEKRLRDLGYL